MFHKSWEKLSGAGILCCSKKGSKTAKLVLQARLGQALPWQRWLALCSRWMPHHSKEFLTDFLWKCKSTFNKEIIIVNSETKNYCNSVFSIWLFNKADIHADVLCFNWDPYQSLQFLEIEWMLAMLGWWQCRESTDDLLGNKHLYAVFVLAAQSLNSPAVHLTSGLGVLLLPQLSPAYSNHIGPPSHTVIHYNTHP